jgi:RNA polymerase sigma-70 factor, ECF subfamily
VEWSSLSLSEDEFRSFFERNVGQLVGLAYLWSGSQDDAVDLAQEALTRAWKRWESLSRHANPEAWVRRVLHNLCNDRWRTLKRERSIDAWKSTDQYVMATPVETDVASLVSRLAPKPRRALVLHDIVGLSVSEVASEMGANEGTVRSWLSRSRATLREQLLSDVKENP